MNRRFSYKSAVQYLAAAAVVPLSLLHFSGLRTWADSAALIGATPAHLASTFEARTDAMTHWANRTLCYVVAALSLPACMRTLWSTPARRNWTRLAVGLSAASMASIYIYFESTWLAASGSSSKLRRVLQQPAWCLFFCFVASMSLFAALCASWVSYNGKRACVVSAAGASLLFDMAARWLAFPASRAPPVPLVLILFLGAKSYGMRWQLCLCSALLWLEHASRTHAVPSSSNPHDNPAAMAVSARLLLGAVDNFFNALTIMLNAD